MIQSYGRWVYAAGHGLGKLPPWSLALFTSTMFNSPSMYLVWVCWYNLGVVWPTGAWSSVLVHSMVWCGYWCGLISIINVETGAVWANYGACYGLVWLLVWLNF
jgi:hypothetical protein